MTTLKKMWMVALICLSTDLLNAQSNDLSFNYDAAGNLIERKVQVLPQARIGKFTTPVDSTVEFKVYPNPSSQFVNIEGPLPEGRESAQVRLMAMNGQLIKTDSYFGHAKAIPVSELKPGLYLLEVRYSKEEASVYKIVVTN